LLLDLGFLFFGCLFVCLNYFFLLLFCLFVLLLWVFNFYLIPIFFFFLSILST
jgi:hypothetical protein